MGKTTGFMEFQRQSLLKDSVEERIKHYREFEHSYSPEAAHVQGGRCMECGIPFCHGETGCPVENLIPEWNDLVYKGFWREASQRLHSTNNFPEFTGRLCPAPCESACTLGLIAQPVSIKGIERTIVDRAFEEGWVQPHPAAERTGKRVAIVGSGPSGLACAQQLARAGHTVTVYEKNAKPGGLVRYGIPDFKFQKEQIDRRVIQMEAEGVVFRTGVHVGKDITAERLMSENDALVLACGAEKPRDLPVPGRELKGVHYALEFLIGQNRANGLELSSAPISATGKNVIVIGGGDTGSDCVGTSVRHGAKSIKQIELFPQPPKDRPAAQPWPFYPMILKTTTSHEEGCERHWAVNTRSFRGNANGQLTHLLGNSVKMENGKFSDVPGTEFEWEADLVLLAMGFVHPVHEGLVDELKTKGLELDARGNIRASFGTSRGSFATSVPNVYACGDMRRGQSLIVWAISEGRKCAMEVDRALMGKTRP